MTPALGNPTWIIEWEVPNSFLLYDHLDQTPPILHTVS